MHKEIKSLPQYLQPKILSAVAYIHQVYPNLDKAVERINTLQKHLSEKEIMWVMSLLTFEKLLDERKDNTMTRTKTIIVISFVVYLFAMFWIGGIR